MPKSIHTGDYVTLRRHLRDLREAAGLSQRALAALLKVPHSWVAKVETGERRIDLIEFCWFTRACGSEPTTVFAKLIPLVAGKTKGGRR